MTAADLRRALYRALRPELLTSGFTKAARRQRYDLPLGDGVSGFVEFADATKRTRDHVWVSLAVGLVFRDMEELISGWCGDSMEHLMSAHSNIGYTRPAGGWFEVVFSDAEPVDRGVAALSAAVRDEAVPFLRRNSGFLDIARLYEEGLPMLPLSVEERLPLAYALGGELDRAYEALLPIQGKADSGEQPARLLRRLAYLDGFRSRFPR
ncbi:hypothetical protein ACLVWQ_24985 [Streptomyces sp. CWNU-52B]|uniref:hypothetical protein n=1 Tax=unclassified Streptomyces TaxID=2593676 RepID=UPI0039C4671A